MKNVVLCGGIGSGLWPFSRKFMPKQFLKLFNGKSLFQLTLERNLKISNKYEIVVNMDQYFIALDQVEDLYPNFANYSVKFLLEEMGRNTAPAVTFAAFDSDEDDILFVTPSDHLIKNSEKYIEAVNKAKKLAQEGYLVTFGIKPNEANSGYGYIEVDGFDVIKFHEKPDVEIVNKYLKKGNYYWNSGIFVLKVGVYLEELRKHSPEIYELCKEVYENHIKQITNNQLRITNMKDIPDISIDYAVMEKSKKIKVVPSEFEWNDVGSFDSLVDEIDSHKAIEIESKNNFYYTDTKDKVIATIGLEDFIVVDTKDALLVTKRGKTQRVKDIVNVLKEENPEVVTVHKKVHRPWGTYETLIMDNGYKIKRIVVKPGKRLSLQKHFHRNEHWIVVSGTAKVQVGNDSYLVRPNESTYIKMGEIHRLINPGKIPVVLIEAQVGEYTGEDDIVRIEDDWKR